MRILVSGASGLVGRAAVKELHARSHRVCRLARPGGLRDAGDVAWDPAAGTLDASSAEGVDAVLHLAGASIGEGRWNPARKKLIRDSRVDATSKLVASMAKLKRPPLVIVSASAVGYYGNRGDEILTEASASGGDFLASVCKDWEAAVRGAESFGARVVMLRFGMILAREGGGLPRMAMPFRFGAGGRLGSGRQWMSWVSLEDAAAMILFALGEQKLHGPVNGVAPSPVTNMEFTRTLGAVLHRPALFPVPSFALRLALGEMADALLLASLRVVPKQLTDVGYEFRHPELSAALRANL
jgi:uncharacterized protein (TIGR01777 family)